MRCNQRELDEAALILVLLVDLNMVILYVQIPLGPTFSVTFRYSFMQ